MNLTEITDPFDARRALGAEGLLQKFNVAGVLAAADVHVACRLAALAGDKDEVVALAAALAVRGPRLGHVCVDLATIRDTAAVEMDDPPDLEELPWPAVEEWTDLVAGSSLVAVGEDPVAALPLRLVGTTLYLDRYWHEERLVAENLNALAGGPQQEVDLDLLSEGVARLFPEKLDQGQRAAAASSALRRFVVIAGGPGTGKTTTVARIVALLAEQAIARNQKLPLVALAAPTGKAAVRLQESVHEEAAELPVEDNVRAALLGLEASTLHRLLGWRPGSRSRFRHDRTNRLPADVVIVDESSMVSVSLMARLVEAVRPDAQLILVGDPDQLTSIEAGAVLGDVVGPASSGMVMSTPATEALAEVTGDELAASEPVQGNDVGDGIVVLDRVHRFGGGIAELAGAIRGGDPDAVVKSLENSGDDVQWIPEEVADADEVALAQVRESAVAAGKRVWSAAQAGSAAEALLALGEFRVLCAHRRGPAGVALWTSRIEGWLRQSMPGYEPEGPAYLGRPLLVTQNNYELRLYNGDTGVIVQTSPNQTKAVFERGGELLDFTPSRLEAVATAYAMTIHKSQGSQFGTSAVLLPPPSSRILTRELLYTGVTRAQKQLILVGAEEVIREAVERPVQRASGLRRRLWSGTPST